MPAYRDNNSLTSILRLVRYMGHRNVNYSAFLADYTMDDAEEDIERYAPCCLCLFLTSYWVTITLAIVSILTTFTLSLLVTSDVYLTLYITVAATIMCNNLACLVTDRHLLHSDPLLPYSTW